MAYEVPPLPYDYAALEPTIDAETMHLHHDKHHQAYVNNANGALEKHPELAKKSAEDLLRDLNAIPEDVRGVLRNNAGGHSNHSMFWAIMAPAGQRRRRHTRGPARRPDQGRLRRLRSLQEDLQRDHGQAVRLRLGLAGVAGRQAQGHHHPQPGFAASRRAFIPSSATTCGSTPTTSPTRTAVPTIWQHGGTWSTGRKPPSASNTPRSSRRIAANEWMKRVKSEEE